MAERIIEVTMDEQGHLQYRLRPTLPLLSAEQYGVILATLARQIGAMFNIECKFNPDIVTEEIVTALRNEVDSPKSGATLTMLQ